MQNCTYGRQGGADEKHLLRGTRRAPLSKTIGHDSSLLAVDVTRKIEDTSPEPPAGPVAERSCRLASLSWRGLSWREPRQLHSLTLALTQVKARDEARHL